MRILLFFLPYTLLASCHQNNSNFPRTEKAEEQASHPLSAAAMALTKGPYVVYDASYKSIPYPNGDVAPDRGVCADVIIRAFRSCKLPGDSSGMDLQKLVHEDMANNFKQYPKCWGLNGPDPNIDHRRVPNLMTFLKRKGCSFVPAQKPEAYKAGDIVAWELENGRTHIGIVVDGFGSNRWPLVVHNIGRGQQKANVLFCWKVIGHYRYPAYEH